MHAAYSDTVGTFETYIPMSVRAAETSAVGQSIFKHDPEGKTALAYTSLTKEVLEHEGKTR